MFYGTRFIYNLLYFISAMSPAYFLFLLQVNQKFDDPFNVDLFGINFDIYTWCLVLFFFLLFITLILKWLLKKQYKDGLGNPVLSKKLEVFTDHNIESINGNVVSFLLGNIIPAVLIIENSIIEALILFALLQTMIYILIVKSSDIFPNVALIILGVDICKTKDGNYLLIFRSKNVEESKVYQIGDAQKSKLFITMRKK